MQNIFSFISLYQHLKKKRENFQRKICEETKEQYEKKSKFYRRELIEISEDMKLNY